MPESAKYRLIGRPESGYSREIRSAFRYEALDVARLDRFRGSDLYQAHAEVQLIPLELLPDGTATQDSTPLLAAAASASSASGADGLESAFGVAPPSAGSSSRSGSP